MTDTLSQLDNHVDYLEFGVSDMERAKSFYGAVFGWTFTDYGDAYCEFTDGRIKGGFDLARNPGNGGALVVLFHQKLETIADQIMVAGGAITKEIFQFPGGERFEFIDTEGNELAVWRVL